jgi:hypothetical protein
VKGHGVDGREAAKLGRGNVDAIAPGGIGDITIGGVDAPAREDVRAAHERGAFVTADHEDLGTGRAVAKHDHGGGRAQVRSDWFRGHHITLTSLTGHNIRR